MEPALLRVFPSDFWCDSYFIWMVLARPIVCEPIVCEPTSNVLVFEVYRCRETPSREIVGILMEVVFKSSAFLFLCYVLAVSKCFFLRV